MKKIILILSLCISNQVFSLNIIFPLIGQSLLSTDQNHILEPNKKNYVVVFLSARCPCSNSHIEEIKNLSQEYKDYEFVAIHSNSEEDFEQSQRYFKTINLPFSVIEDKKYQLADQFGAQKTPHSFVVSKTGEVLYQGGVSNSNDFSRAERKYLREALVDIKNGVAVRTPEGRTLGCSIVRE